MFVDFTPNIVLPEREPKRMIEAQKRGDGRWHVKLNFSSLDVISTCMRKANLQLERKLLPNQESPPLVFGKAIHKALEHFYTLPLSERKLEKHEHDRAELMAYGHGIDVACQGPLEAIRQFAITAEGLRTLPENDKRSLSNGVKILRAYFEHYADDKLVALRDEHGSPMIERSLEYRMIDSDKLIVDYFGTIDMLARHEGSGETLIVDHKTASSLGREFVNRAQPNHQFTGYIWLVQKALGMTTNKFLVNGIQVAKTKGAFERVVTERSADDFVELEQAVLAGAERYVQALERSVWPMSAPSACTHYGGCPYLHICSLPVALRP